MLQKMTHERYQNLSEEEKKKQQNGPERYKNLSDEKNTLVEYRKNIIEWEKKRRSYKEKYKKKCQEFLIFRPCKFSHEIL